MVALDEVKTVVFVEFIEDPEQHMSQLLDIARTQAGLPDDLGKQDLNGLHQLVLVVALRQGRPFYEVVEKKSDVRHSQLIRIIVLLDAHQVVAGEVHLGFLSVGLNEDLEMLVGDLSKDIEATGEHFVKREGFDAV